MEPITTGMQGAAVEDVQSRLLQLGYTIDDAEVVDKRFGTTTEQAVSTFRLDSGLAAGHAVDIPCWSALVDASYQLGDRTRYLHMPNIHGADEQALQQFQENVGLFADGMAFQDTYAYINRLHHVWEGKPSVTEAESRIGFARAANVLERFQIAVIGEDPIARSVASRMWNIATATTDNSGMMLCDSEVPTDVDLVLEIASDELPADAAPRATIALAECHNLAQRIRTANVAAQQKPARIRIELTGMTRYNGTFTASDAQTLAVRLLDGVCDALAD